MTSLIPPMGSSYYVRKLSKWFVLTNDTLLNTSLCCSGSTCFCSVSKHQLPLSSIICRPPWTLLPPRRSRPLMADTLRRWRRPTRLRHTQPPMRRPLPTTRLRRTTPTLRRYAAFVVRVGWTERRVTRVAVEAFFRIYIFKEEWRLFLNKSVIQ